MPTFSERTKTKIIVSMAAIYLILSTLLMIICENVSYQKLISYFPVYRQVQIYRAFNSISLVRQLSHVLIWDSPKLRFIVPASFSFCMLVIGFFVAVLFAVWSPLSFQRMPSIIATILMSIVWIFLSGLLVHLHSIPGNAIYDSVYFMFIYIAIAVVICFFILLASCHIFYPHH